MARNPNTPVKTLHTLRDIGTSLQRHVDQNPVVASGLASLEKPDFHDSESELWRRTQQGDQVAWQRLRAQYGWNL